jgi:hypothetical protein
MLAMALKKSDIRFHAKLPGWLSLDYFAQFGAFMAGHYARSLK